MSAYKVGDLASLFPSPPVRKSGAHLQSLFKERNQKNSPKEHIGKKSGRKKMKLDESSSSGADRKKIKLEASLSDHSENNPEHVEGSKPNELGGAAFKRSKKKKRKEAKLEPEKGFFNSPQSPRNTCEEVEEMNKKHNKPGDVRFKRSSKSQHKSQLDSLDASEIENVSNENSNYSPDGSGDFNNPTNNLGKKVKKKNKKSKLLESSFMIEESNGNSNFSQDGTGNFNDPTNDLSKKVKKKNKKSKSLDSSFMIKDDSFAKPLCDGDKSQAIHIKRTNTENNDLQYTLFIGNLPLSVTRKELHKLFRPFGPLKTVRLRGSISPKNSIPKKISEIKNKYHEGLKSHKGFVVFQNREAAVNALSLNGTLLDNHHIVVDFATQAGEKKIYDDNLSVFVGNLPFDVDDETVWSAFEECGEIQAVRVIRDRETGLGKGFGYIMFQENEAKEKALASNEIEVMGRKVRVKAVDKNPHQKMGSKESLKMIRSNVSMKRAKGGGNKKSVKKLLKKGKLLHHNKKVARMLGKKLVK